MGLIGLGATMGPALGPTLDWYMTQHFSWRWAFYIGFAGAVFTPLNYMSLACLSQRHLDTGASMIHVIRFIAGAMGTAFATSHMEARKCLHFLDMGGKLDPSHTIFIPSYAKLKVCLMAHDQPPNLVQVQLKAFLQSVVTLKSYIFAFQDCMAMFGLACFIALAAVPFINGARGDLLCDQHLDPGS